MADFVEVETRFDGITVPIPDVAVGSESVPLPSFPGLSLPDISLPDIQLTPGTIRTPDLSVPVPSVRVETGRVTLPSLPGFDLPVGVSARIEPTLATIDLPLVDESVTVVVGLSLIGPRFDTVPVPGLDLPTLNIPSISVSQSVVSPPGAVVDLPVLSQSLPTIRLPDIPPLSLPTLEIPTVDVDRTEAVVPDPTTLRVTARLRTDGLRRELLRGIPPGFVEDPTGFVLTAVLEEAQRRVGSGLVPLLADLVEGILRVTLSDETQERIRDRAGDDRS